MKIEEFGESKSNACNHSWRLSFTGHMIDMTTKHYVCDKCNQWKKHILPPQKSILGKKSQATKAANLVEQLENITGEKYHE